MECAHLHFIPGRLLDRYECSATCIRWRLAYTRYTGRCQRDNCHCASRQAQRCHYPWRRQPENFYLQTQPQLWEVLGIQKGGHDYFIQITADAPHWGGLSGATPSEAVSWGKIKPDQLKSTVVIYGDSTIALPLVTAYAVSKARPRPRRELFSKREELLKELKQAYIAKKLRP